MANDLHEARKQTKALLAFARAVVAQDEALDNLADIGKATEAAEKDRTIAQQGKAQAEDELARAKSLRDTAMDEVGKASLQVGEKIKEAEAIARKANADAAGLVDVARQEADGIRAQAQTDAAGIIAKAELERAEIGGALADARDTLNELNAKIGAAADRLAATNAEITRLRALFAPA